MTYHHKNGMIYDTDDGQTIATMSGSATPEQACILAAAPALLAALDALHIAVTMRPMAQGGLSMAERMALDQARATLNNVKAQP
jgi:hypothetical protein